MKLSVIIPVYQVEKTLQRCVQSILQQGYDEMEVILVDDGSTDHSPEICEQFGLQDRRIIVIHQQNKGLASARNTGISHAHGTYVTFVDSDDYLEENTFSVLMNYLFEHTECDILEYPVIIKEGCDNRRRLSFEETSYHSFDDYWLDGKAYQHAYACNKIYRHSLFEYISFKEGMAFEDVWTIPELARHAKQITTVPWGCYHYCDNPEGITARANVQDMLSLLNAHLMVLPTVWNSSQESLLYFSEVLNIQLTVARMGGERLLSPYPYPIKLSRVLNVKQNIKLVLLKILGINLLCQIYKLLKDL